MKPLTATLMYCRFSGAAMVLGAPASAPRDTSPVVDSRLVLRQGEGDPNRWPGAKNFNICVPFLNITSCPLIQGPGAFPIADGQCFAHNTRICACWCSEEDSSRLKPPAATVWSVSKAPNSEAAVKDESGSCKT
ncbi:hypothetical protein N656DRAFT_784331 [Canariomyces notabilis]|uniref:Secreted protein n=1 Tax=Canariomyces notabilis TaxID=2074819 RepID=A0AAN6QGE9_9PEZI|nr:hypothetical protein N656DRAFT_784331 [Canariomyces arenarius]